MYRVTSGLTNAGPMDIAATAEFSSLADARAAYDILVAAAHTDDDYNCDVSLEGKVEDSTTIGFEIGMYYNGATRKHTVEISL